MIRAEVERLARSSNALRPDWRYDSLVTFIETHLGDRPYRDAAVAMTWIATDPETRTPARVLEAGPWWRAVMVDVPVTAVNPASSCPWHPDQPRSCQCCAADRRQIAAPDQVRQYAAKIRQRIRENRHKEEA